MSAVVVVGVDGSDGSLRALRWAAEEARTRGAALKVVNVWSYISQASETFDPAYGEEDARQVLADSVAALGSDADGVEVEPEAICDLPAAGLLKAAHGADLLVVGSRGIGGFAGLLLGSVSHQLAQRATCPLVIVPGEERSDPAGERDH